MKLETFFEKFDQFADAPDAVEKMRELVLELAVQGKLVAPSQKPDKHPAWVAFRKEISERVYSYDPGPPPPFEIPDHWEWCVLDEVAKPCGQKKPDEKFTYIDVGSIDNARGELKPELNTIEVADAPSRARKLAQPGSVIYATVRPYLKNIAVIEKEFSPPAIISTAFAILHPLPFVESRFLFYWLRSSAFEREVRVYAKGVAYPAISDGDLKGCVVPVPPPSEQKRIVAKVDELMALCDRLEAQQQERETRHAALARASLARFADAPTPANLPFLFHPSYAIPPADLRKSILTLAVQGKLVPFDTDGEEQTVGDHIEFQNGYAFKSEWFKPSGMRLCRNLNVSHGNLDWRESAFVDDKVAKEFERFALGEGDIVLSLDRPLIATGLKVARVTQADLPCLLLQRVAKPVPKHDQLDLSYFMLWLNSSEFVDSIDPGRSNGVPHISTRQVQRLPFVLPPLAEQRRIVAKVEQLMALVDALETQLAASRATAANLLSALVAELTGTTHNGKATVPSTSTTGRRGRPRKSP